MKIRTRLAVGFLSGLLSIVAADGVMAQNREQLPVVPYPKNMAEVKKEAGPLSQPSKDAIKAAVESHMGRMTEGKESPEKARESLSVDLRAIVSEDGLAMANKTALDLSGKIIRGNYLPAAKVNAMLTIQELSEGSTNPRLPYSGAVSELFNFSTTDKLPCHLRALALVGLDRHIRFGKSLNDGSKKASQSRDSVAGAMVVIINSQPRFAFEEEAHWWMVRRAYDVLMGLHAAGAKEPMSPNITGAAMAAMDQFNDPTQLTSVRYAAGTFLTRFDFASMKKTSFRMKLFLGVAQYLDQEVVGWYESESDKSKMQSGSMMGGMGGMGGMGDMGGMMGGMSGGMGDMGAGDGGLSGGGSAGYGGMGGDIPGGKGGTQGPKPIDSQQWDLRIARRKLNMHTQLAHALLKGNLTKEERDYHPTGKGIMEAALPPSHTRAGKFLIEALEEVQEVINERSLTTVASLMGKSIQPLTKLRDAAELIPAFEEPDPADKDKTVVTVKSFKEYSPRMQSFKKADASGKLESTTNAPPADGGAAPAPGTDNKEATPAPAAGGQAPAAPGAQ